MSADQKKLTLHIYPSLIVLASLSTSLVAQPAKPKTAFEGYSPQPTLVKDEGCARDYAKTFPMDGIELHKRTAELVAYGCIEKTIHIYHVFVAKQVRIAIGSKPIVFMDVMMLPDAELEKLADRGRQAPGSEESGPLEWIDLSE